MQTPFSELKTRKKFLELLGIFYTFHIFFKFLRVMTPSTALENRDYLVSDLIFNEGIKWSLRAVERAITSKNLRKKYERCKTLLITREISFYFSTSKWRPTNPSQFSKPISSSYRQFEKLEKISKHSFQISKICEEKKLKQKSLRKCTLYCPLLQGNVKHLPPFEFWDPRANRLPYLALGPLLRSQLEKTCFLCTSKLEINPKI